MLLVLTAAASACHTPVILDFRSVPTITLIPVKIILLEEDYQDLPQYLSEPLLREGSPVKLQDAPYAPADAVLISPTKLFMAGEDVTTRKMLLDIVESGKILVVYRATTRDLQQQLKLKTGTMTPTTTYYAAASVGKASGTYVIGGVLMSKGHDEEAYLMHDIRDFVGRFRSVIQQAISTMNAGKGGPVIIVTPGP